MFKEIKKFGGGMCAYYKTLGIEVRTRLCSKHHCLKQNAYSQVPFCEVRSINMKVGVKYLTELKLKIEEKWLKWCVYIGGINEIILAI